MQIYHIQFLATVVDEPIPKYKELFIIVIHITEVLYPQFL